MALARPLGLVAGLGVALLLTGCSYDYMQHTDRVAYRAGDAVKANLEGETINPAKRSMFNKWGLGRNGTVIPATTVTTAPPTTPGT
jgi:hypothetical protein